MPDRGKESARCCRGVEDALVDAGYDDFVVVTERGSFHWQTVERARAAAAEREITYTENLKAAGDALRMVREAVETLGPPEAMRSEEAVLATLGPEPIHEAQAIIEGIQAIAAKSEAPRAGPQSERQPRSAQDPAPPAG